MEAPSSQPKRRPRISLLSLLLLTTAVAAMLVAWREHRHLDPLREENQRLRGELGVVQITDPKLVCYSSQSLGTFNNFRHFRWRAYVPVDVGAAVKLKVVDKRARGGTATNWDTLVLPSGESTFELIVYREAAGEEWVYSLGDGRGSLTRTHATRPPWYDDGGGEREFTSSMESNGLAAGESQVILDESATRTDGSAIAVTLSIEREP